MSHKKVSLQLILVAFVTSLQAPHDDFVQQLAKELNACKVAVTNLQASLGGRSMLKSEQLRDYNEEKSVKELRERSCAVLKMLSQRRSAQLGKHLPELKQATDKLCIPLTDFNEAITNFEKKLKLVLAFVEDLPKEGMYPFDTGQASSDVTAKNTTNSSSVQAEPKSQSTPSKGLPKQDPKTPASSPASPQGTPSKDLSQQVPNTPAASPASPGISPEVTPAGDPASTTETKLQNTSPDNVRKALFTTTPKATPEPTIAQPAGEPGTIKQDGEEQPKEKDLAATPKNRVAFRVTTGVAITILGGMAVTCKKFGLVPKYFRKFSLGCPKSNASKNKKMRIPVRKKVISGVPDAKIFAQATDEQRVADTPNKFGLSTQ